MEINNLEIVVVLGHLLITFANMISIPLDANEVHETKIGITGCMWSLGSKQTTANNPHKSTSCTFPYKDSNESTQKVIIPLVMCTNHPVEEPWIVDNYDRIPSIEDVQ